MVDQVRRRLRHAPGTARWAKAPSPATESDQLVMPTVGAAQAQETLGQDAAFEEGVKLIQLQERASQDTPTERRGVALKSSPAALRQPRASARSNESTRDKERRHCADIRRPLPFLQIEDRCQAARACLRRASAATATKPAVNKATLAGSGTTATERANPVPPE